MARDWFDYITLFANIFTAIGTVGLGLLTVYFQFFKKPKILTIDEVSCNNGVLDGLVGSFMSFVITNHTKQDIVCYKLVLTLHYKNKKPNSFEVSNDSRLDMLGLDLLPFTIPSGQELESGCEDILNDTWSDVNKLVIAIYGIDNKVIDRKIFEGKELKKIVCKVENWREQCTEYLKQIGFTSQNENSN